MECFSPLEEHSGDPFSCRAEGRPTMLGDVYVRGEVTFRMRSSPVELCSLLFVQRNTLLIKIVSLLACSPQPLAHLMIPPSAHGPAAAVTAP